MTPAGLLRTVPYAPHGRNVSSSTASSIEHWKVAPGLLDVKRKVATSSLVDSGGTETKLVSGSDSIVHVCSAGLVSKPFAEFRARTRRVCVPGVRLPSWYGVSQPVHGKALSSEHSKVAVARLDENSKFATRLMVPLSGPLSIVVSGALIVHV